MSTTLSVEFFDTDTSSYKQRLSLSLKSPGAFRVTEANVLEAQHADGTTRFVPLHSVKQYYELSNGGPPQAINKGESTSEKPVAGPAQFLIDELLRRVEAAGFEVPKYLKSDSTDAQTAFLLNVLVKTTILPRDSS